MLWTWITYWHFHYWIVNKKWNDVAQNLTRLVRDMTWGVTVYFYGGRNIPPYRLVYQTTRICMRSFFEEICINDLGLSGQFRNNTLSMPCRILHKRQIVMFLGGPSTCNWLANQKTEIKPDKWHPMEEPELFATWHTNYDSRKFISNPDVKQLWTLTFSTHYFKHHA